MDEYLAKRAELIAEDRVGRLDSSRREFHTADSEKADEFVRRIRAAEAISVWGADNKAVNGADDATHLFPGMAFLTGECYAIRRGCASSVVHIARELIVKTKLFKIMSKVSKSTARTLRHSSWSSCRKARFFTLTSMQL